MKYFTIKELSKSPTAQRLGIDNTPPPQEEGNLKLLVEKVLDPIREAYKKPIIVNSGYRCHVLNRKIGGVPNSHHLGGMAADIQTVKDTVEDNKTLFNIIQKMIESKEIEVTQLIDEKNYSWIHISYNPADIRNQILHLK